MPSDKQRRQAERRRLQRQIARRAERAVARRRMSYLLTGIGIVLIATVIVVFVVATDGDHKSTTQSAKSKTPGSSSTPGAPASSSGPASTTSKSGQTCMWTKSGTAAKKVAVPDTTNPAKTGTTTVNVQTSRGPMTFTLDRKAAPCASESFVSLTKQKYFDSTSCHRLTSGGLSVLQCGDPTGTGSGGPGYSFDDELTGKEKYTRGVLAMANSGPNTNGSQFFIVYKNSQLGAQYTVFGRVTKGLDVVDKIAAKGSTPANDGKPKLPITITKATIAS